MQHSTAPCLSNFKPKPWKAHRAASATSFRIQAQLKPDIYQPSLSEKKSKKRTSEERRIRILNNLCVVLGCSNMQASGFFLLFSKPAHPEHAEIQKFKRQHAVRWPPLWPLTNWNMSFMITCCWERNVPKSACVDQHMSVEWMKRCSDNTPTGMAPPILKSKFPHRGYFTKP